MAKSPLFSIITINQNNLAGLIETHNSIKNQLFQSFEWVVIDGGSGDGAIPYLETTEALWTSEPDGGIYDAMNKGITRAGGDYLLFLNAGDALTGTDTLEKIHRRIKGHTARPDFIYGDSHEDSLHKPARSHATKNWGMFTHHQAMLYRREAVGGLRYDLNYQIAADYDFTCRFLKNARGILYLPFPVCVFESGGVSQRKTEMGRKEQFAIRKNFKISPVKNILIYSAQAAAWHSRKIMPRVYWRLKSSDNRRRGFART